MRYRSFLLVMATAMLVAGITWTPGASAYSTFSGCVGCHGIFGSGLSDPEHNAHATLAGFDCNECHGTSTNNPPLNDCTQCHGRPDEGGAGLRQHHRTAGAATCSGCHASPETTAPENVAPSYYPGPANLDPCNGSEEAFPSFTVSLDNDGDDLTDTNDTDCQVVTNNPPVAVDDAAATPVNTPVTIDVLANDTDTDGDTLTVSGIFLTNTAGTVFNNNTDVTFDPQTDFCGTTSFEYTASDGVDDSNLATVTVAVGDANPPVVTAPADLEITLPAGTCDTMVPATDPTVAAWLASATALDPEEGTLTVTNNAPAAFALGTTPVTFTATDSCGNTDAATANVIILCADNTPPVVTAPTPDPLEVTAELCATSVTQSATADNFAGTIGDWLATATATDAEDGTLPVTDDAPASFPIGDTLVTFSATDLDGATGTATATVSVAETPNDAPVITVPADLILTVPLGTVSVPATDPAIADWLASVTATDTQDGDLTAAVTNDAPAEFPLGTTTVTFTVSDSCGVAATATATVTIQEEGAVNTPPVVTAPPPFTYQAFFCATTVSAEDPAIQVWLASATATDAEDGTLPVFNDAPAEFPAAPAPGVTTTVTFTATDSGGLTDTDTSTLTIIDSNTAPVVTVPDPLLLYVWSVPVPATTPAIAAWLALATASDVEDGTLGVTTDAPAEFLAGETMVTFSATDSCGATTTATSTVIIVVVEPGDLEVNVFVPENIDVRVDEFLKAYFWRDDMDVIATLNTYCQYKENIVLADSGRRDDFNSDGFIDSLGRFPTAEFGFDCGTHFKTIYCVGLLRDGGTFYGTSNEFNVSGLGCGGGGGGGGGGDGTGGGT